MAYLCSYTHTHTPYIQSIHTQQTVTTLAVIYDLQLDWFTAWTAGKLQVTVSKVTCRPFFPVSVSVPVIPPSPSLLLCPHSTLEWVTKREKKRFGGLAVIGTCWQLASSLTARAYYSSALLPSPLLTLLTLSLSHTLSLLLSLSVPSVITDCGTLQPEGQQQQRQRNRHRLISARDGGRSDASKGDKRAQWQLQARGRCKGQLQRGGGGGKARRGRGLATIG